MATMSRRRRTGLALVVSATGTAVLTAGLLVTITDPEVFPHVGTGIWWAATTVTTVGHGDLVPAGGAGRTIAAVLMFGGVAAVAFVTAAGARPSPGRSGTNVPRSRARLGETLVS